MKSVKWKYVILRITASSKNTSVIIFIKLRQGASLDIRLFIEIYFFYVSNICARNACTPPHPPLRYAQRAF